MSQDRIDHIAAVLGREDTVVFLGSGLSRWSGLPTWPGLIEQLRDELTRLGRNPGLVERELADGDLLLAASYGVDQLTDVERCRYLRKAIQVPRAVPSRLHEAVVGLGASCFITTNYDHLLEAALAQFRPSEIFDVVTPANVVEIPAIVQARATHFVFKPHGDIGNCDSIVLTREDYRRLQGPRRATSEATRHLLASRPIVFLGFGLRDPDFLLMRDYLFNTFDGNPADHIAVMPDVTEDERGYWRRHYGIDLVSYATNADAPPESRHDDLLSLLQRVKSKIDETRAESEESRHDEHFALTLARFGRGITSEIDAPSDSDFPLPIGLAHGSHNRRLFRAISGEAVSALGEFNGHLILEGAPGAGKSHTIGQVVRNLAVDLEAACLSIPASPLDTLRVPVRVNMRDYRDDLDALLESALPVDVPLSLVLKRGIGHFFLDGFNEAVLTPDRENLLNEQLGAFLQAAAESSVIVTTRNAGQLTGMGLPVAEMGAVPEAVLFDAIESAGLVPETVNPVTVDLLRRPLFFASMLDDRISISETKTVHDVYRQLIAGPDADFASRFGLQVPLLDALADMAFRMIDSGQISLLLGDASAALSSSLPLGIEPSDVVDFLLESGMLIATPLRRLAFYHHSITEYLAAFHLSKMIATDESVVVTCLGRNDWDQALLLSLGFVDPPTAEAVHRKIMEIDCVMGLRGLHYVENEQESWIDRSLRLLPRGDIHGEPRFELEAILVGLPFKPSHELALLALAEDQTRLGGAALGMLGRTVPDRVEFVLDAIVAGTYGYNYCASAGKNVGPHLAKEHARMLLAKLDLVSVSDEEAEALLAGIEERQGHRDFLAIRAGAEDILKNLDIEELIAAAVESRSVFVRTTIGSVLRDSRLSIAVEFFRSEILAGKNYAIVDHYFQLNYGEPKDEPLPSVTGELISALERAISDPEVGQWAVDALTGLVREQPETRQLIAVESSSGLVRALLQYARGEHEQFAATLKTLIDEDHDWDGAPTHALAAVEQWDSKLLVQVLRSRDIELALPALDALASYAFGEDQLELELDDLDWWVEWLADLAQSHYFGAHRLGTLLAQQTTEPTRQALLKLFDEQPDHRPLLAAYVLPFYKDLSGDDFSSAGIEWLLNGAKRRTDTWRPSVLSRVATEQIVHERLLPLLQAADDKPDEREVLMHLICEIGRAHGRRYVGEDGQVLA